METRKTLIIAEIGSAWRFGQESRHLSNAREAIKIAKECGADCVKFQWVSDPRKMEQRRNVPEGSYDILAWPEKWIRFIATYCEEFDIEFMCTVFIKEDVETLNPYVKRWKVASLEAGNEELVTSMYGTGKEIIASTGGLDADEIRMMPWLGNCKLLHCTVSYPCPLDALNVSVIAYSVNQEVFVRGLSDHSANVLTGAVAVACGAEIVETHFRLPETPEINPDYRHSLTDWQLEEYIRNIRQAELMLGDGIKKVEPSEEWALKHKVRT